MTPVEIKLEHGLSVAVIFIEDMAVMLTDVRNKIREEVDELVPENFHFILNWGPPISRFQETKTTLKEALHEGNVLVLRKAHSSQNPPKRMVREIETSNDVDVVDQTPPAPAPKVGKVADGLATPETTSTSTPSTPSTSTPLPSTSTPSTSTPLPSTSTSSTPTEGKRPPAKRPVQRTLTGLFGAKLSPTARFATAAVRKGVHIYSEQEIQKSSGAEKERRKWWNEKAKQLCEDPQLIMLRGEAIDQKLHEEWRIHKGTKLLEEEIETRQAINAFIEKYHDLEEFLESKNRCKQETLTCNVTRLKLAVQTMASSRDSLQELSVRLQNKSEKMGTEFQQLQKELAEQKESHKFHYRELCKAQEAMSKALSIKKSQLRELMEKKKNYKAE